MSFNKFLIAKLLFDYYPQKSIEKRDIRAGPQLQMKVGLLDKGNSSWIDDQQARSSSL